MKILLTNFLLILAFLGPEANAQDFVYQPINPAFGGNTFNYQWQLNSAEAQNGFEDPMNLRDRDPLEDFQESLNRQILNQLSRQLVTNQFGEEGLEEGTFILGDFQIDITPTGDGIGIFILDGSTGNTTNVLVPFF
jgi:curli production assembly/transport component CsgF